MALACTMAACASGSGPAPSPSLPERAGVEERLVDRINEERSARGLRSLAFAPRIAAFARRHSERMAADAQVFHTDRRARAGAAAGRAAGENVGVGSAAGEIHDAFMDSRSHRHNILEPHWTHVGVGVAVGSRDGAVEIWVTEVFAQR